jgi:hypothetical protein
MIITKEWLEEQKACASGIKRFLNQDKTDSIEVLNTLISEDELADAVWLMLKLMDRRQKIKCAIFAAEQVLHIFDSRYPDDKRPRLAIEAAKKVLDNDTEENRKAAADVYASAAPAYTNHIITSLFHLAHNAAGVASGAHTYATNTISAAAYDYASTAYFNNNSSFFNAKREMTLKILNYGKILLNNEEVKQ